MSPFTLFLKLGGRNLVFVKLFCIHFFKHEVIIHHSNHKRELVIDIYLSIKDIIEEHRANPIK